MQSTNNMITQFGPDTCNEEIYATQSYAESMINFDSVLPEDELYRSLLNESVQDLPPTFTLDDPVNTTVLPDMLPLDDLNSSSSPLYPSIKHIIRLTFISYTDTISVLPASLPLDNDTSEINAYHFSEGNVGGPTKRQRKSKNDDKYAKRLEANKKSAQASRERRKTLKAELEVRVDLLQNENIQMHALITEMETENKVLKNEFLQLQSLIADATAMSRSYNAALEKFMANSGMKSHGQPATAVLYLYFLMQYFQQFSSGKPRINLMSSLPISVNSV